MVSKDIRYLMHPGPLTECVAPNIAEIMQRKIPQRNLFDIIFPSPYRRFCSYPATP